MGVCDSFALHVVLPMTCDTSQITCLSDNYQEPNCLSKQSEYKLNGLPGPDFYYLKYFTYNPFVSVCNEAREPIMCL